MKNKHNGGFTLVEILVSMVILAAVVIPTCTSLVLSVRMNAKSNDLLQAQLAVSSTVEALMAEGITEDFLRSLEETDETGEYTSPQFPGIIFSSLSIDSVEKKLYYTITIADKENLVTVDTSFRNESDVTLADIQKEVAPDETQ